MCVCGNVELTNSLICLCTIVTKTKFLYLHHIWQNSMSDSDEPIARLTGFQHLTNITSNATKQKKLTIQLKVMHYSKQFVIQFYTYKPEEETIYHEHLHIESLCVLRCLFSEKTVGIEIHVESVELNVSIKCIEMWQWLTSKIMVIVIVWMSMQHNWLSSTAEVFESRKQSWV